jgi:hypothetical protein
MNKLRKLTEKAITTRKNGHYGLFTTSDFYNEMSRFLPGDVTKRTLDEKFFSEYLVGIINSEVLSLKKSLISPEKKKNNFVECRVLTENTNESRHSTLLISFL